MPKLGLNMSVAEEPSHRSPVELYDVWVAENQLLSAVDHSQSIAADINKAPLRVVEWAGSSISNHPFGSRLRNVQ